MRRWEVTNLLKFLNILRPKASEKGLWVGPFKFTTWENIESAKFFQHLGFPIVWLERKQTSILSKSYYWVVPLYYGNFDSLKNEVSEHCPEGNPFRIAILDEQLKLGVELRQLWKHRGFWILMILFNFVVFTWHQSTKQYPDLPGLNRSRICDMIRTMKGPDNGTKEIYT